MTRSEPPFDKYLEALAKALSGDGFTCAAVIPDVDGGLVFAIENEDGSSTGVKLEFVADGKHTKRARFLRSKADMAVVRLIEDGYRRFVATHPHRLLEFEGQDILELPIGKEIELQQVWKRHLEVGRSRWSTFLLEKLDPRPGALYLVFSDLDQKVGLRISDGEDPRLEQGHKLLRVNQLALSLTQDTRTGQTHPFDRVERFVAYLLAHTTGPDTRIRVNKVSTPSVTLYGREVQLNPFLPEGRQGASGMAAALFGGKRNKLKIVSIGDASCRQTFPPSSLLRFFDTWSYFPVRMAPPEGAWVAIDFSEAEVIGGSEQRLKTTIAALKRQNPDLKIAFIQTCISRMIGDDVKGVLEQELNDSDLVVLNPDFQTKSAAVDSQVWSFALPAFEPLATERPASKSQAVNLVGLGQRDFPATDEISKLLEELGVEVNACLFPSFGEADLESFSAAPLTIANACSIVKNAFAQAAQQDTSSEWVFAPAPFGLAGTQRWATDVISRAGMEKGREAALSQLARRVRQCQCQLEPLAEALQGTSMLLVASSRYSAYMFDPAETFGIPLLEFLTELGMGVELLVYCDVPPPNDLLQAAEAHERISLSTFDDPGALLEAADRSSARFMLTSIRRNASVLTMGKIPIFVQAFEMGLEGALRTAEGFIHRSRFKFVDDYRGYFKS